MTDHFRGRLEVFGLADLLQWMELNRRSGRLTISRGADRRTLDWINGELNYVSGSLPRHRLGIHLLRTGALPAGILYEMLEWRDARFEYDPAFPVQRILRISLSMRGQALAFQGVKNLDDTARQPPQRRREDDSDPREIPFEKTETEER